MRKLMTLACVFALACTVAACSGLQLNVKAEYDYIGDEVSANAAKKLMK